MSTEDFHFLESPSVDIDTLGSIEVKYTEVESQILELLHLSHVKSAQIHQDNVELTTLMTKYANVVEITKDLGIKPFEVNLSNAFEEYQNAQIENTKSIISIKKSIFYLKELLKYANNKRKDYIYRHHANAVESFISRPEMRMKQYDEFKRRMLTDTSNFLNIKLDEFIRDLRALSEKSESFNKTLEMRQNMRREGKNPPPIGLDKSQLKKLGLDPSNLTEEAELKALFGITRTLNEFPLNDRVAFFINSFCETISKLPSWSDCTDPKYTCARESLEKYIISKLYDITYLPLKKKYEREDQRLYNKVLDLNFIKPHHLDIDERALNRPILDIVISDLQNIDLYKTPADLIDCIVESCRLLGMMFSINNLTMKGADDFLPTFIYTIIFSKLKNMKSTIEYIEIYRDKNKMKSEDGYYFTSFCSAVAFVEEIDHATLKMEADEYNIMIQETRKSNGFLYFNLDEQK